MRPAGSRFCLLTGSVQFRRGTQRDLAGLIGTHLFGTKLGQVFGCGAVLWAARCLLAYRLAKAEAIAYVTTAEYKQIVSTYKDPL